MRWRRSLLSRRRESCEKFPFGESGERRELRPGVFTLAVEQYAALFKRLNITCVVRFNKKLYDRAIFQKAGIRHVDLWYEDG